MRSIPAWAGETMRISLQKQFAQVYPRVGGGNPYEHNAIDKDEGLSPRGRGKLLLGVQKGEGERSIPAWAGETR